MKRIWAVLCVSILLCLFGILKQAEAFTSVTGTVSTDFTFAQGETYLVEGQVTMTGVTTIEGDTTIKYDSTGSLDISNPVFNTTSSNQAVFTSKDDNSVGETVTGSSGSPSSYPNALTLAKGSARFLQIRYADDGIIFPGNETLSVRDSEFLAVGTPVDASSSTGQATVNLKNLLIVQGANGPVLSDDGTNSLTVTASNITMAHLTGDGFSNTTTATGSSLSVTDSLFVDIQGTSVFDGTVPSTENFNAFFQTPQNGTGANDVVLTADPILVDWFLDQTSPVINGGSQSASSASLYHYTTDTAGAIEANSQADIGYHFPPSISQFSVLATNSIWLKSNSMVSGDIGVNEATAGPFLDSNVALAVGHDMVIPAAINLRADSIKVKTGAVVNGNVYHNQLENNGTINGTSVNPIAFPILDVLPLFRLATLGTVNDISVAAGTVHVLAPGDYGVITVDDNATLQFTGGLYQIQKIDAQKTTSLLFDAPSEVRIKDNLKTKQSSTLGASAGATLNAGDIQFFVEGADVGTTLAVEFGHTHSVLGHFYAPNGTLSFKRDSTFAGIFVAKDVMIGHDAVVQLDPVTGQPIVSTPIVNPNGGLFTGSVNVSLSTITSGATIHYTTDGTTPTTASPVFTAPFTLTESTTVKAIAVRADYADSSESSAVFSVNHEPVAAFTAAPLNGELPLNVGFDASASSDLDDDIATYAWDFGDGGTGTGVNTTHQYNTDGTFTTTLTVTDTAGLFDTATEVITVTNSPPVAAFTATPLDGEVPLDVTFDASASTDPNNNIVTYAWDFGDGGTGTGVNATHQYTTDGTFTVTLTVTDALGLTHTATSTITATETPTFPGTIDTAPPLDETVIYNVASSTAFLYTGPNAIQTGMDPATIEPVRAAVVRGEVKQLDPADNNNPPLPLQGVTVTILDHPEYGQTVSREDGFYDMAINGGGQLIVQFSKTGFMPSQRKVQVPWQDFAITDDVVLIPLDPKVTTIGLASIPAGEVLEAQGTTQTDSDGTRTATLIFSSGTTAEMVMPDGTKTPITSLNMRATEYTVGDNGPMAMPAVLPPTTAYTYMADFTADEALAVGATSIEFNQPVYGYVDNFLNVKPGEVVPNGYYDQVKGQWIPEDNGVVMDVINIDTSGATPIAELDLTGDGVADDHTQAAYVALNITTGELEKLAELYPSATPATPAGLWRVPMMHFSNFHFALMASRVMEAGDDNYPIFLDATAIQNLGIEKADSPMNPPKCDICEQSIIQVQAQIFGETVPVTGTPFNMHYNSDRVPGYKNTAHLNIPLIDPKLDLADTTLKNIQLIIDIAGRRFPFVFSFAELQAGKTQHSFVWDGMDAYGREASGAFTAKITIGYEYPIFLARPTSSPSGPTLFGGSPTFGRPGQVLLPARSGGPTLSVGGRRSAVIRQSYTDTVSVKDYRSVGLGGWTLDANHVYDPFGPTLHLGTGPRRGTQTLADVVTKIAGEQNFSLIRGGRTMEINDKGEVFLIGHVFSSILYKVDMDGTVTTLLQGLSEVTDIALAPDGTIYMAQPAAHLVIKRNPNGGTAAVAGNFGVVGSSGDGGPANQSLLNNPRAIALDKEGNLFIADTSNSRVRMVDTSGIINTVAGGGTITVFGGLATQFKLSRPSNLEVDDKGNIFIGDFWFSSILKFLKVDAAGKITHFAGDFNGDPTTDGIPATETKIITPHATTLGKDGSLYWTDQIFGSPNYHAVKFVDPTGKVRTINQRITGCGNTQENVPVDQNCFFALGLAIHPDGNLLFTAGNRLFRISSALPGFTAQEQVLPSEDGSLLYVFDNSGRHTETRNALTDAIIFAFAYEATGQLSTVTDGDGDVTSIQRDIDGNPISITSQDGQVSALTLDSNGYLATVANPNTETFQMVYDAAGLMTAFTRPKALTDPDPNANYTTTVTYDAVGLMDRDTGADNGFLQTVRTEDDDGYTVSATTAEGRVSTFRVEEDAAGNTTRTNTGPDGLALVTAEMANGNEVVTSENGIQATLTQRPDPRFGMLAPLSSLKVQTPGGLVSTITPTRTTSVNANGVVNVQVDTLNINGRTFTSQYQTLDPTIFPSAFFFFDQSPEGRETRTFVDEQGRIVQQRIPGIHFTDFSYDTRGRLTGVVQGDGTPAVDRTSSIVYNPEGYIGSITDPENRVVSFQYDAVGRVTKQILPDLREINFTYDANGNVESITPPGRPLHGFDYTNVDLENEYAPPNVTPPLVETSKFFTYNLDKQLTAITRPDGQVISMGYDTGGRLSNVTLPNDPPGTPQVYSYSYFPDLDPNVFAGNEGNLEKITAPDGGILTFAYDGLLLLSSIWTGTVSGSVNRTYDNDFRITSRTINGGNTINFGYDNDNLLISAGAETLIYDSEDPANPGTFFINGLLRTTTLGAVSDTYQYSQFGEQANYTAKVSGTDQFMTSFDRDKLGRITQKIETVQGVTHTFDYGYNTAGYLMEVKRDGVTQNTYTYDLNGNRENNDAVYDNQDRLTSTATASYTYTDNGELLTKTEGTDITQYKYDVLGNLLSVTLPSSTLIEYIIDGRNRRIGKKVDGVLQQAWLYKDDLNPIAELDGTGNITARFVYASRTNIPDYMIKGGVTYRIVSDYEGSPRLVIDTVVGAVIQAIEYDEWGNVLSDSNPGFQPFAFAGGLYDLDTKLARFGARDYDPEIGRWTSKDPIRSDRDGPNFYGYTQNDPVNFFDLLGLDRMGVHSEVSPTARNKDDGHSWISYTDSEGNTTRYSLWPDWHAKTEDNAGGSDVRQGLDAGYTAEQSRYYDLSEGQVKRLKKFLERRSHWSVFYNCSDWASELVYNVTGESLNAGEYIFGAGTPRELSKSIMELEAKRDTSPENPLPSKKK